MKSSRALIFCAAGLFCLVTWMTGCVPANDYYELMKDYETIEKINEGLEARIRAARRDVETWQDKKREFEAELNYYRQIAEAGKEAVEKLSELDQSIMRGAKDAGLAVAAPAEAGGGEITVSRGKLRILGEVLFKVGSHELSSRGRQTIAKVARILNSPQFQSYYIRVDGHTDNQPLVRTKEKYKTNWILGAWRAHSVMQVLINKGILRKRIFMASFGQYTSPDSAAGINPNSDASRRRARRVEIALIAAK